MFYTTVFKCQKSTINILVSVVLHLHGMIIHSPQDGAPPLSVASQNGHEEVVRVLLESGAQELPDKVRLSD